MMTLTVLFVTVKLPHMSLRGPAELDIFRSHHADSLFSVEQSAVNRVQGGLVALNGFSKHVSRFLRGLWDTDVPPFKALEPECNVLAVLCALPRAYSPPLLCH